MKAQKKINIITIHFGTNHGSVLQAYALSNHLCDAGYDAQIIDYIPERYKIWKSLLLSKRKQYPLLVIMAYYPIAVIKRYRGRRLFDSFIKNNLRLTRRYHSAEDLKKHPPMADIYITGSDQVWNDDYNGDGEYSYFLDFVSNNGKKLAYAASFGKDSINKVEYRSKIKTTLSTFDGVSVREKEGQNILASLGIDSVHVVDPVFLRSKQQWREFAAKCYAEQPYILVYVMDALHNELLEYAQKIKEQTGKKIYVVSFNNIKDERIDKCFYMATPKDFVALIDNADIVITNSFHGTAFSALFQKRFITIGKEKYNSRMCSLLGKLNLEAHFIPTGKNYDVSEVTAVLERDDFEQAEAILQEWIVESKKYIQSSLTDE